nr:hypothetical protein GCM10020185_55580 [Pseudomonas brassicacearum subsp. brassicacearum]
MDCLTLWLTNLLMLDDPEQLSAEREALLDCLAALPGEIIFLSATRPAWVSCHWAS